MSVLSHIHQPQRNHDASWHFPWKKARFDTHATAHSLTNAHLQVLVNVQANCICFYKNGVRIGEPRVQSFPREIFPLVTLVNQGTRATLTCPNTLPDNLYTSYCPWVSGGEFRTCAVIYYAWRTCRNNVSIKRVARTYAGQSHFAHALLCTIK